MREKQFGRHSPRSGIGSEGSKTLTPTTIEALTYTYDKQGNRITQLRQNAVASNLPTAVAAANIGYDVANELTRWNSATTNLTYDSNGNLATETQAGVTTTYTWDARNRLTGISRTGLTASFIYDGLGRRQSKTINGTTAGFWYDGSDVYAELTGATPSVTYIRGLSIDEPYIRKGASDEFYETDALGTSIALTNPAGTSQTTYTYEPFGNSTQAGTVSSNEFQYTGRENDGTGLYFYGARYYHPKIQRFVGEDPIEFGSSAMNLYVYVANRPLSFVDPFGLILDIPSNPVFQVAFGNLIAKSPSGLRMITELQNSLTHYQVIDRTGWKVSRAAYLWIEIDPTYVQGLSSCSGGRKFTFSLERALAHEMGHLIDYKMNQTETIREYEVRIIGQYENPVSQDLNEPIRTQHIDLPCKRSNSEK